MRFKNAGLTVLFIVTVLYSATTAFSAQFIFTPRATATETYTDNVFLDDENTEEDFITDVTVGGDLSILSKSSGLNLTFDPGIVWYADDSRDDTWRLPANLEIYKNFSRKTRLDFFNRFLRTEDPDGNRPVINEDTGRERAPGDSTVRRGRGWYLTNFATARLDHKMGTDDTVYGQFLYSLRREEDSNDNDNDRLAPSAGLTYWFGPKWGTEIETVYTRALFENDSDYHDIQGTFQLNRRFTRHFNIFGRYGYALRDEDNDEDYQVHAPSAGINYELADDARISVGFGYYYQDNDESDSEEGPFANSDIFKIWNFRRGFASLVNRSGLDRNDFGNERLGFEWYTGLTANARYDFLRNFYGNVNTRYRYSDFINESRKDHRLGAGAGLGWLPTRWMTLSLDYAFNMLSSNEQDDYEENRVWFRLTLQPDRPWRF